MSPRVGIGTEKSNGIKEIAEQGLFSPIRLFSSARVSISTRELDEIKRMLAGDFEIHLFSSSVSRFNFRVSIERHGTLDGNVYVYSFPASSTLFIEYKWRGKRTKKQRISGERSRDFARTYRELFSPVLRMLRIVRIIVKRIIDRYDYTAA